MKYLKLLLVAALSIVLVGSASAAGIALTIINISTKNLKVSYDSGNGMHYCDHGENIDFKLAPGQTLKEWCGNKDTPPAGDDHSVKVTIKNETGIRLAKFNVELQHEPKNFYEVKDQAWFHEGLKYFMIGCTNKFEKNGKHDYIKFFTGLCTLVIT